MNNFYYQNPEYISIVPDSFIAEVITEINETRYCKYIPLKMLFVARENGGDWLKEEIARLAQNFTKTHDASLIMEALKFTTNIEIEKGELVVE